MSTRIPVGRVTICERGKSPEQPPFVTGHYRRWALSTLREGRLPRDYVAFYLDQSTNSLREVSDPAMIDWTEHVSEIRLYFMCRLEDYNHPGKPWRVHAAETGAVMGYYSTPHEAEGAIGLLVLKSDQRS